MGFSFRPSDNPLEFNNLFPKKCLSNNQKRLNLNKLNTDDCASFNFMIIINS